MSIELQFAKHDYAAKFAASPVVSSETIEAWLSAGVLTPDETAGASRILNLLRQQRMGENSSVVAARGMDQHQKAHHHRPSAGPLAAIKAAAVGGGRRIFRWFRR